MYRIEPGGSIDQQVILSQLPPSSSPNNQLNLKNWINTPTILIALGIVFLILLSIIEPKPKTKLANSNWGGKAEVAKATKKAQEQIANPTRNKVSLYINLDPQVKKTRDQFWSKIGWKNPIKENKREQKKIKTFYVPDAQRGTTIIGSAGTGKTFSVADPLYRSTIDQGFPLVLYDFKYPEQSSRIAAYAAARGYEIEVFAPGYAESCTCNLMEFIKDENDSISAAQLAKTINANMNSGGGKKDEFFESAGNALIEGILLLTKAVPKLLVVLDRKRFGDENGNPNEYAKSFDDVMTAQALLALPNIAKRLAKAKEDRIISAWTGIPFNQAISVKDAEKTISGIVSTATAVFRNFIKRDFVSAFVGNSNLPERIEGKKLVIFGLDNINRDVISPILASILHMTVRNNIYGKVKRKDPLIVGLDEVATIKLPSLNNWLAEGREMGFCGILGLQHLPQLEKAYGKELARTIFGNCATKFIFNPQENESAKLFADMLGETEITTISKSTSRSSSKGGGSSSTSTNKQKQKKHLFEPAQFLKLTTGRCVIINPNFVRGDEAYMPILHKIQIRSSEVDHKDWSEANWEKVLKSIENKRPNQLNKDPNADEIMKRMLIDREDLAKVLLPMPETPAKAT